MKVILGLLAIVGVALAEQADMNYFLYEGKDGMLRVEDLTAEPDLRASASDLTFHFFSRSNPTNAVIAKIGDLNALRNSAFSASKDTTFIIHGWESRADEEIHYHITENTLRAHDVNVIVVDWSPIAAKNYVSAQGSVRKVGEYIADFIKLLQSNFGLQLTKLKLVGHSLGAHIAGNAGAALGGKVNSIVGLDSAGPLFLSINTNNRLDPTDAVFVQAIHTNGGLLGYRGAHGDADYYPNGGSSQPGCGRDIGGACSHARVYSLYAESLISDKFVARQCKSYSAFTGGSCNNGDSSFLGRFQIDNRAKGDYYLTTNDKSPFAQG